MKLRFCQPDEHKSVSLAKILRVECTKKQWAHDATTSQDSVWKSPNKARSLKGGTPGCGHYLLLYYNCVHHAPQVGHKREIEVIFLRNATATPEY